LEIDQILVQIKAILLVATFTLSIVSWFSQILNLIPVELSHQLGFLAALIGLIFIGHSAIKKLMEHVFGIDLLATVAIIASIYVGEYLAAAVVELMLGSGEILENIVFNRASKAISKLIEEYPKKATVIRDGQELELSVSEISPGEIVIIKPGGMVPVDGRVTSGHAILNQASVTGEPMPVDKTPGNEVYSGTIVEQGVIEIETTHIGEDSTYGRIIRMVREAQENKAPIVSLADRFASYYIPLILIIGISLFVFTRDPLRMASVFIIACPCALTLATPTAIVASIGNSARKGILIRNGESLEKMEHVDTLVLDKTGTITIGNPIVLQVKGFNGVNEKDVLGVAAGAEKLSEHPLAKAVIKKAEEEGISPLDCSEFEVHPGLGICVTKDNQVIRVGSEKMMKENSIPLPDEFKSMKNVDDASNTVILVARENIVIGSILLSDALRDDVADILTKTKHSGAKKIIMLTGDKRSVANSIGKELGFDEIVADLLPSQKVEHIKSLQREGRKVLMVGDGINDAPALAVADVGVAMGLSGTDVAIETAEITLATNRLDRIPLLFRISRTTMKIIKFNILFAMIVNILGLTLSVLGHITPIIAAIVHESSAIIVLLNALRLLKVD
ncbi:MAG: cation-translocating P-type ATPase, partial [Candidatus Bathyarchaeia archaeon]